MSVYFRIKWRQRVFLCRVSLSSWQRGQRERKAATCSNSTTRKPCTTPLGPMISTLLAGQNNSFLYKCRKCQPLGLQGGVSSAWHVFYARQQVWRINCPMYAALCLCSALSPRSHMICVTYGGLRSAVVVRVRVGWCYLYFNFIFLACNLVLQSKTQLCFFFMYCGSYLLTLFTVFV